MLSSDQFREDETMLKRIVLYVASVMLAIAICGGPVAAQQPTGTPGVKRTILQTNDVPGTKYESVLGIAEIGPNVEVPRHTHPGTENSYVMEGSLTLNSDGHPEQTLQAGQGAFMPAEHPHWGKAGPQGAKILAVWTVEKGKPLASPAPAK
jgi:quercetin dioxygenase-like cupin family protein